MMKVLGCAILLSLSACFPSLQEVRADCEMYAKGMSTSAEKQADIYMQCVDNTLDDINRKRAAVVAFGQGLQQAGQSMQRTNCITTCNYGTCYTSCR